MATKMTESRDPAPWVRAVLAVLLAGLLAATAKQALELATTPYWPGVKDALCILMAAEGTALSKVLKYYFQKPDGKG